MTSTTLSPHTLGAPSAAMRLVNVMRLHLANRDQIIVMPWLIMGFIFAVSLLVAWLFGAEIQADQSGDPVVKMQFNGAVYYFLVYMLVLAVMAISQMFPFAQSYSVTRRDFYAGTVLTFLGLSVVYSIAITALGWVEDTTSGWGLNVSIFNPFGHSVAERLYITVLLFFFFFMIGMASASVYVRWKANGMYVFFGLLALLIVGLVWLATATDSWRAIGEQIATMGLLGVVSWSLVPSFLAIVTGYSILRRAVPRN